MSVPGTPLASLAVLLLINVVGGVRLLRNNFETLVDREELLVQSSIDSVERQLMHAVSLLEKNETGLHKHLKQELEKQNVSKDVHDFVTQTLSDVQAALAKKKGNDTAAAADNAIAEKFLNGKDVHEMVKKAVNDVQAELAKKKSSPAATGLLERNESGLHKHFKQELEKRNASKDVHEIVAQAVTKVQAEVAKKKGNETAEADNAIAKKFLKGSQPKAAVPIANTLLKEQNVLKDLFANLKRKISGFNKNERVDKKDNDLRIKKAQDRLDADRKALEEAKKAKPGSFDVQRLTNRTAMEERELNYWNLVANNQHGMFHANLKVTHGLMARVKDVLEAYSQKLTTGKIDAATMKAVKGISLPHAFVEIKRTLHLAMGGRKKAHKRLNEIILEQK